MKLIMMGAIIVSMCYAAFLTPSDSYTLTQSVDEETHTIAVNSEQKPDLLYQELRTKTLEMAARNPDIIGYIYLPGVVEQFVLSNNGKGYLYYLNKNALGKTHWVGSTFMNDLSKNTFKGNSLLHGHNSNRDVALARIKYLKEEGPFQKARLMTVYDRLTDSIKIMKLFTFFNLVDGQEFVVQKKFTSEPERIAYNQSLHARSIPKMETGLIPDLSTDVLFLQACTNINGVGEAKFMRDVVGFYALKEFKIP